MEKNKKILWYEGMTLDPHHFQQWDRFHQSSINSRFRSLAPHNWGLTALAIDRDSLTNGLLKLTRCGGILPDGVVFNMPDDSVLPPARNFADFFQATQENLAVYIALPTERTGGKNASLETVDGSVNTRFTLEEISIVDENSGGDHREVGVARPNFQIRFGNESLEDFTIIKIGEIQRDSQNQFVLNDEFIPTCVAINASPALIAVTRSIFEFLVARTTALRNSRKFSQGGQLDVSPGEVPLYGQLRALSQSIPMLKQYHESGRVHPETLYNDLVRLAGELTAFSADVSIAPSDFSIYDHSNLTMLFHRIEKQIKQLLGEVKVSKNYHILTLDKKSEALYTAHIEPESLLDEAGFYLACSGDLPESKFTTELPEKIRVASPDMINEVLSTATRALQVSVTEQTPRGLPSKNGVKYIRLEKKGPFWDAIKRNKAVSFYIPTEFSAMDAEFVAVKESS